MFFWFAISFLCRFVGLRHCIGQVAASARRKRVHFVQLQNHPAYQLELKGNTYTHAVILSAITWLREDLRLARLRGVTDIIINFHQDNDHFPQVINSYERRQFLAIMKTFRPLAILTGHRHQFSQNLHVNDALFGNVPVYRVGAAYTTQAQLVTYDRGQLQIRNFDVDANGRYQELANGTFSTSSQALKPICAQPGTAGNAGVVYATRFIPDGIWNLRHALKSGNNLDADSKGNVYMRTWNEGNPYQLWEFQQAYPGWPEFNSWYVIKQASTGRVLDSNTRGEVYTTTAVPGNAHQQWWPIKTERGEILLRNRATNRFLDSDGSKVYTTLGYQAFNQNKIWEISHGWYRNATENVRYFQARTNDAYRSAFPSGSNSDSNWQYLGSHDFLAESSCIGW